MLCHHFVSVDFGEIDNRNTCRLSGDMQFQFTNIFKYLHCHVSRENFYSFTRRLVLEFFRSRKQLKILLFTGLFKRWGAILNGKCSEQYSYALITICFSFHFSGIKVLESSLKRVPSWHCLQIGTKWHILSFSSLAYGIFLISSHWI